MAELSPAAAADPTAPCRRQPGSRSSINSPAEHVLAHSCSGGFSPQGPQLQGVTTHLSRVDVCEAGRHALFDRVGRDGVVVLTSSAPDSPSAVLRVTSPFALPDVGRGQSRAEKSTEGKAQAGRGGEGSKTSNMQQTGQRAGQGRGRGRQ